MHGATQFQTKLLMQYITEILKSLKGHKVILKGFIHN